MRLLPLKLCQRLLPNTVGGVSVFGVMTVARRIALCLIAPFILAGVNSPAQTADEPSGVPAERPSIQIKRPPLPAPDSLIKADQAREQAEVEAALEGVLNTGPDYSQLTPNAERNARLDALFERLKGETDSDAAKLVAEEIWALWLDSGSATVDLILLRGTAFEKRGETALARRMYDHVTTLMPDYAEGWARSARLAMEEKDFNRALTESAKTLILEPREFYALWTMGNVLEKLGRVEEAFEIYKEALALYPEHPAIKARVNTFQSQVDGDVL